MKNMNMKYYNEYKSGNNVTSINIINMSKSTQNVLGVNQVVISDGASLPKSDYEIINVMDSSRMFPYLMQNDECASEHITEDEYYRPLGVVHVYDQLSGYAFSFVCLTLQRRKVVTNKKGDICRYNWVEVPGVPYKLVGTFFTAEMRDELCDKGIKWQGIYCPKVVYEICKSHSRSYIARIAIKDAGMLAIIDSAVSCLNY